MRESCLTLPTIRYATVAESAFVRLRLIALEFQWDVAMTTVFISHSTADLPVIEWEILSICGVQAWLSRDSIHTAERWERSIMKGLRESDWFLVIVSQHSSKSEWVHRELSWAEKHRKGRLISVLVDDVDPADLHLALETLQHLDLRSTVGRQRFKLLWKEVCGLGEVETGSQPQVSLDLLSDGEMDELECRAESGDSEAQFAIARRYLNGKKAIKDTSAAVGWLRRAANQGHAAAQRLLGSCYKDGTGVKSSATNAVEWFRCAAEQGHSGAQCDLGWCYQKGYGVAKDLGLAIRLLQKAARQGHPQALYNLGYCYQFGLGFERSIGNAIKCYEAADSGGNKKARLRLEECRLEMSEDIDLDLGDDDGGSSFTEPLPDFGSDEEFVEDED